MQTITFGIFAAFRVMSRAVVCTALLGALGDAAAMGAQGWVAATPAPAPKPKVADLVVPRYVTQPPGTQQLGGMLGERFAVNLERRLLAVDEAGLLDGFRKRPGKHEWIGEHIGKFLDAATRVYRYNKDARLKVLMDRMVKELIATQESDGYLGTYGKAERWTSWDVWVHKYNLLGLLAYYQTTSDEASLAAAVRVGNLLVQTFGPGKRDLIAAGTHVGMAATSVLHPMVLLYRATGDVRYLAFCHHIVKAYDHPNGPRVVSTLAQTGSVLKTANAKAYEMLSNLIGLLKLYEVTGDKKLLNVALIAWKDVAQNRLYLTGSASSKEHFQKDNVLPGEVKDNIAETCVTVNWLEFNVELLGLLGEARFADEIEKTVMNHLLGAQDAHNGNFSYYTPLNGRKPFTPGINCCVSSGPRGMSMLPELAWGQLDGAPALTLYTAGRAGQSVVTEQGPLKVDLRTVTDFPRSGRVTLHIATSVPATFPVYLRVPAWASSFKVAGELAPGTPGSFMRVERKWKTKNTLVIEMDLPIRVTDGGPSYEGRVAIRRGPQVLALDLSLQGNNPPPSVGAFVGLKDSLDNVRLAGLKKHKGLAFKTQAMVWDTPQNPNKPSITTITLVPYADARIPQVWLLKEFSAERAASRQARELARPHLKVARVKTPPQIDGVPDDATFKNKTPMIFRVATGRPRSQGSFDVAWDDNHVYVAAWITDPTPERRDERNNSDGVLVGISRKGYEGVMEANEAFADVRFKDSAVTDGIRRATALTPDGYTVEMAIPWSLLKTRPKPGTSLGFDIRNRDQGRKGIEDDGDWQWANDNADTEISGLLDLTP